MRPISVFDAHCDTISRCWREYEDIDRSSGAVSLERTEKAFDRYCQIFALWTADGYTGYPLGGDGVENACRALLREGSWYFDLDGLVIFSDEGEMGSLVSGMIEFHIPYAELRDVIDEKWIPGEKNDAGRFVVAPMDDIDDGTVEIISLVTASDSGETYCVTAEGAVYDVRISTVHYSDGFYETALLWYASHMSGCAIQLQAQLPDGMPELMISYSSGGERHSVLLTHGEEGGPALVDDTIEAVG